jgi:hypothetical protein
MAWFKGLNTGELIVQILVQEPTGSRAKIWFKPKVSKRPMFQLNESGRSSMLRSLFALVRSTHIKEGKPSFFQYSYLLSQMLTSSSYIITNTPTIMFDQMSGHLVDKSILKFIITVSWFLQLWLTSELFPACHKGVEKGLHTGDRDGGVVQMVESCLTSVKTWIQPSVTGKKTTTWWQVPGSEKLTQQLPTLWLFP